LSPSGEMFDLLKEDHARRWSRPLSWWNFLALGPVLLLLIPSVYNAWKDAQIAKRQQTTVGIIDGYDPPNHNQYSYTFSANGHRFTGWDSPSHHDFSLGQQITVYYDPTDPPGNSAYDFHDVNPGGVVFIGFLLFACIFLPFSIFLQRRSRKKVGATPTDA
jgi:hypothetical protein